MVQLCFGWFSKPEATGGSDKYFWAGILIALLTFTAVGWVLECLKGIVFPRCQFLIGQGENRYHDWEKFGWGVLIALVVGIIGSLVVNSF